MPTWINNDPSTSLNREIRVFLSSTFKDMEEERRYLVEQVFPEVRQACNKRQVVFTEIDLRWGITEEEAKNGRTVEICLEEIDHSRNSPPFFIGFLGERYGWIPTHNDLEKYLADTDSPYATMIAQALDQGVSVTELEMQHAFLNQSVNSAHTRVFLRSPELTDQLYQAQDQQYSSSDFYDAANGKLTALKTKLRAANKNVMGIDGYQSVAELGEAVKSFLMQSLDTLYPDEPRSALQNYLDSQAIYAQSRLDSYVPLAEFTQQVMESLQQTNVDNQVRHLHIYGESGSGKSAFLAYLNTQIQTQWGATTLAHYVGAETSDNPQGWRDQIIKQLRYELQQKKDQQIESPELLDLDGSKEAWQVFYDLIADYQQEIKQPVVLLLDAINQMQGVAELYEKFNPINLPQDVYFISSAIVEYPYKQTQNIQLPRLDAQLIQNIIKTYLANYQKTLPLEVAALLAHSKSCQNGLFLKTLLEELRLIGRHETLLAQAKTMVALETPAKLFAYLLQNIDAYSAQNGVLIEPAKQMMQFISLSYRGLTQHQLKQLVSQVSNFELHDAHLSPVLARLRNFLLLEQGRFRVMHSAFELPLKQDAVEEVQRMAIVKQSGLTTKAGLLDTLYQYIQVKNLAEVSALLNEHFFELFEFDENLCRDALTFIGAGEAVINPSVQGLMDATAKELELLNPIDLDNIALFLTNNSFINLAELILQYKLVFFQKELPAEHWIIADSINSLAEFYRTQYRFDKAVQFYQEALRISKVSLPIRHLNIAAILNNLALLYHAQHHLDEAEPLFQEALAIQQMALPAGHLTIATSLNNLAGLYESQNRLSEAELLFQEALEIRQVALPAGHPDIASSLHNLAGLYHAKNCLDEAETLYKKALDIYQISLPAGHPDIASNLHNLATLYRAQNRIDEAVLLCQEALSMRHKSLSAEHPDIAKSIHELAGLSDVQGRLDEAEILHQKALKIRQRSLPTEHPDIANSLNSLAVLYHTQHRLSEAELLSREALRIRQASLPAEHPSIANSFNNLALLYSTQNRLNEAESLYKKAIRINKVSLPAEHPDIAVSLNNLAGLYHRQNRLNEAEPLYQEALKVNRALLLVGHPSIARDLNNLAALYHVQSRLDKAEPLYQEALKVNQASLPAGDPTISLSFFVLASLYKSLGKLDLAKKYLIELLEHLVFFSDDKKKLDVTLASLKEVLEMAGYKDAEERIEEIYKLALDKPKQ